LKQETVPATVFIPGITELINLQREGSKAKVYQVRQVRAVLLKYRLAGEGGED